MFVLIGISPDPYGKSKPPCNFFDSLNKDFKQTGIDEIKKAIKVEIAFKQELGHYMLKKKAFELFDMYFHQVSGMRQALSIIEVFQTRFAERK